MHYFSTFDLLDWLLGQMTNKIICIHEETAKRIETIFFYHTRIISQACTKQEPSVSQSYKMTPKQYKKCEQNKNKSAIGFVVSNSASTGRYVTLKQRCPYI